MMKMLVMGGTTAQALQTDPLPGVAAKPHNLAHELLQATFPLCKLTVQGPTGFSWQG